MGGSTVAGVDPLDERLNAELAWREKECKLMNYLIKPLKTVEFCGIIIHKFYPSAQDKIHCVQQLATQTVANIQYFVEKDIKDDWEQRQGEPQCGKRLPQTGVANEILECAKGITQPRILFEYMDSALKIVKALPPEELEQIPAWRQQNDPDTILADRILTSSVDLLYSLPKINEPESNDLCAKGAELLEFLKPHMSKEIPLKTKCRAGDLLSKLGQTNTTGNKAMNKVLLNLVNG